MLPPAILEGERQSCVVWPVRRVSCQLGMLEGDQMQHLVVHLRNPRLAGRDLSYD
jgi:hypothetical protein